MNKPENHRPRKRFGQNFLQDPSVIAGIVKSIMPHQSDLLVEIGPGQGAITYPVLNQLEGDQHLIAIELDRDLVLHWQQEAENNPRFNIVQQDVLKVSLNDLLDEYVEKSSDQVPLKRVKLFGNLPYNISTPLLIRLIEAFVSRNANQLWFDNMVFMLQKEVVDRIVSEPNSKVYGRLSVMLQSVFETQFLFDVPPGAFFPPPKVMSAMLRLKPLAKPKLNKESYPAFSRLVAAAFSQRRKTLKNTLKDIVDEAAFEQAGIDSKLRAETLTVDDFIRLNEVVELAKS